MTDSEYISHIAKSIKNCLSDAGRLTDDKVQEIAEQAHKKCGRDGLCVIGFVSGTVTREAGLTKRPTYV